MSNKHILWYKEVGKDDVERVGGKGANLGEMLNAKLPVPDGFIVTADAYFYFLEKQHLQEKIHEILKGLDHENSKQLETAGEKLRDLIKKQPIPEELKKAIGKHYEIFSKKYANGHIPFVAVRSSATAEDLPSASFAGQQETYLNVQGKKDLIDAVKKCWASLFTNRAIYYRAEQGFDHHKVGLAAVIQLMVQSEKSGVAFSSDPVTNDDSTITIEAIFGLGEYIVGGQVTPDHYEVDKHNVTIKKKEIRYQNKALIKKGTRNVEVKLLKIGNKQKLTDKEILQIAKLVKNIEKHYKKPQDVEWAIENGEVFIVQSRPITTIGQGVGNGKLNIEHPALKLEGSKEDLLISCDPASPGVATGVPKVLKSPKENYKVKPGDILVAAYTSPDYVPAMKKAAAIVTEMGGRTSHAAIVSRELGIPAVVGAAQATSLLKKEKMITVNGSRGEVFKGIPYTQKQRATLEQVASRGAKLKTKTKIYTNLAQPESADRVARMNVDGIGLLRAEFIVAHINIHPRLAIEQGKQKEYINALAKKITMFAKPFGKRPIVYRATDFRTNEYRHLKGGEKYEFHEENPMIGYRGASRYIRDTEVFSMELEALKKVRKAGHTNVWLMIPFVRIPEEIRQIKEVIKEHGLDRDKNFKLWMMVEVPSSAIMVEEFIKEGIDGISIGTNDLTMLLLGVDRDNQEIAYIYDERRSVVMWALKRVIEAGKKHGITVSICGQAPSDYPELAEKLVEWGITSLSVTPDVVDRTREMVYELEKKLT
ncbi:phosphoenolpyruvate synthase [Candidatus Roizmanbacteria bacterium RIFCSPLOWO2_02_FULL_37_19]|uniref:Phosphoenolpyruvate synthase n=1 Tax=Candidatus Roizmanbacteria bacterium RIFCSPHIGHO2_02_FULL_37_24 TaxID=1802037 RepID=A0A1F7GUV0_9BACT|nr:MAG: phosphoenolpyruvate synthase [Candidatus Roizmanbacteria bacterium RIFCSPHIGHO2_01_FULL_38_41]OGK22641.1 MAG: phosphoenolpyruvate synthase [Candidatus Roizmanbacteria bacterium RIFCSPHIGHO2_02_FULL_37_24]OGK32492.1 MAG: phosphoenolpyruvate synthase [Candidatus Roizmanbacteria bacterium RIFCSPHIGHO2_12_FULL_37_23]OGK45107.1 MAG: phosphoenolpyruvate synthase [Candidatus Roizmanbacteria bacterium RIFCSPLOWO2_01_FULL_37_57]OGK54471.1 MAG: phosphoenolpyruvate synthase [Candidatus Roizmanbact